MSANELRSEVNETTDRVERFLQQLLQLRRSHANHVRNRHAAVPIIQHSVSIQQHPSRSVKARDRFMTQERTLRSAGAVWAAAG